MPCVTIASSQTCMRKSSSNNFALCSMTVFDAASFAAIRLRNACKRLTPPPARTPPALRSCGGKAPDRGVKPQGEASLIIGRGAAGRGGSACLLKDGGEPSSPKIARRNCAARSGSSAAVGGRVSPPAARWCSSMVAPLPQPSQDTESMAPATARSCSMRSSEKSRLVLRSTLSRTMPKAGRQRCAARRMRTYSRPSKSFTRSSRCAVSGSGAGTATSTGAS
mmetsp:Transcript_107949/g.302384  ORF Transcript_107949/g.302384 Transcript_107949/m.302384 type:complete len:222 (-) Transcript_107949:273-938(-)